MGSAAQISTTRIELEARILVAALKQSVDQGDLTGADQAYQYLAALLRQRNLLLNEQANQVDVTQTDAKQSDSSETARELSAAEIPPAQAAAIATPRPLFYDTLHLDLLSTYKDIHVNFLRLVKEHIAGKCCQEGSKERDFRVHLRTLCIAHDILKDPTTRRLYDLNVLGVQRNVKPSQSKSFNWLGNSGVRIGELLQCANILEASELAIAVDMHKAMPEMMFGEFMVYQGFVSQAELEDALLGQKLIEQAKITVAQFQLAMLEARQKETNLKPVLLEHHFVNEEDLL